MTADDPPAQPLVLRDGLTGPEVLEAVRAAREQAVAPDTLALVGYGASGVAALSLALHQRRLGIGFATVTCVGAAGQDDPVSGAPLADPSPPRVATRISFVAGDDTASESWTRRTAAAWRAVGWSVDLTPPALS